MKVFTYCIIETESNDTSFSSMYSPSVQNTAWLLHKHIKVLSQLCPNFMAGS